jgi:non-specific serine/threonine protein kinase/serine/threonine-protein kinase
VDTGEWNEVKRLFGEALDLAPAERRAWLETACPNVAIRTEVLSLLEEYDASEDFLEQPATLANAALEQLMPGPQAGQRVGPWRLARELGRGGMGVVFEAIRDGEDFQTRFALKLIRGGLPGDQLAQRFRYERIALSKLSHPGIAALVDGGATESGLPYLVMEYVEGIPIDRWCDQHDLDTRARVRLLIDVCHAVGHAHQRLVVHRDLKPSNILVTPEGRPKLLDFGIAKMLGGDPAEGPEATRTGMYVLTPEYCSPEQVTGDTITTATDIYSLGVLLYVLLSRQRPYELEGLSPLEAMRRVVESDPRPPSAVAPAALRPLLRGDLDHIVLRCLRKSPAERYPSADALTADLEAWLDGRPVSAVPPSRTYKIRKWIRRHRGESAALAALALSILAGVAATAWQAREARLARYRAEQRALEIQQLSRSLVFEVHSALFNLPGSTEARALLLDRAMQFFDGAARTAGQDPRLLLELAEGYRRLGNVLGSSFSDNLGRKGEALRSFEKGLAAAAQARAASPPSYYSLRVHSGLLVEAALAAGSLKRLDEAGRYASQLASVIGEIDSRIPATPEAHALAATNRSQLAMILSSLERREEAMKLYQAALAGFSSLPPEEAAKPGNLSQQAFAYKRLGALFLSTNLAAAEEHYLCALEIERRLLEREPGNNVLRYNITFALSDLGLIARNRNEMERSLRYFSEAAAIRDSFLAADPRNVRVLNGASNVHCHLAVVNASLGRFPEARKESATCRALSVRFAEASPSWESCARKSGSWMAAAEVAAHQGSRSPAPARARFVAEVHSFAARALQEASACPAPPLNFDPQIGRIRKLLPEASL